MRSDERNLEDEPEHAVILDLRSAETSIEEDGDELLLLVDDGDSAASFRSGAARHGDDAIRALDQLAEMAGRLSGLLRVRRGDARVFDGPEEVEPAAAPSPPVNATGW